MIWFFGALAFFWVFTSVLIFFSDMQMGGPEEDGLFDNLFYYIVQVPLIVLFQVLMDVIYYFRKKMQ
jgi:hypothetical protein